VFSASHASGRANHAPNNRVHRHMSGVKLLAALSPQAPCRRAPALRRLGAAGLHRPAVPCRPVARQARPALGLRIRNQVQVLPNQRPVLRTRNPASHKLGLMRNPQKGRGQLLQI